MHPVAAWEKNFSRAEESLNIFIWIHSESTHYLKKTESMWFGQDLFSQTNILTVSSDSNAESVFLSNIFKE